MRKSGLFHQIWNVTTDFSNIYLHANSASKHIRQRDNIAVVTGIYSLSSRKKIFILLHMDSLGQHKMPKIHTAGVETGVQNICFFICQSFCKSDPENEATWPYLLMFLWRRKIKPSRRASFLSNWVFLFYCFSAIVDMLYAPAASSRWQLTVMHKSEHY